MDLGEGGPQRNMKRLMCTWNSCILLDQLAETSFFGLALFISRRQLPNS